MECELRVFVAKMNSDHYLAFDDQMNVYQIYGLYFKIGFLYKLDPSRFSLEEEESIEMPTQAFLSSISPKCLDKAIKKLTFVSSNSTQVDQKTGSTGNAKGKQFQLLNYQKPFVENNPFEFCPVEDEMMAMWVQKEGVMNHMMLSVREGDVPDKKKCDLFVGNLKITGKREIKMRSKPTQSNMEVQFLFWNDLVCNKGKIIFWKLLDPIPAQVAVLLNSKENEVFSFVGLYHLDSFESESSKSFITVVFEQLWLIPFLIKTKASLEFEDLLSDQMGEIKTVPEMADLATDLKRIGKSWQGVYFPFILAGPNETIRIINTKIYQTDGQEDKMRLVFNQTDRTKGCEYEIEVSNGSVDNINPIFISLKNGRFNFILIK